MMKFCRKCQSEKPATEFPADRQKRDGRHSRCKACGASYKRLYQSDPEYKARERIRSAIRRQDPERRAYAKAYNSAYKKRPEGKLKIRSNRLRREFGISIETYNQMLEEQAGLCAICGNPPRSLKRNGLVVDHDHTTGIVRGLLCVTCNVGIGNLKDNVKLLQSAIEYLDRNNTVGVVSKTFKENIF